jgi:Zn-finger nucleic acid-binding protein
LTALPWLSPLSWIVPEEGRTPDRAWKDPIVNTIFLQRLNGTEPAPNGFTCPACKQPLVTATYEGARIYPCCFCAGTLVENSRIPRIIARTGRDRPCAERVNVLARAVLKDNQSRMIYQKISDNSAGQLPHLSCPKCKNPMSRGFYSQAHLIEVDRCSYCGLTWFDKDELEMLQCMIENRLVPDTADAAMSGARTEMTP